MPAIAVSIRLNGILAAYSQIYVVILGIYYKLQTFIYLPANGIVQGMRPLIGYNYGAGENKRVSQIFKIVLCMSGIIMVLGTVICLLIPGQLMGLFTHTEATIQTGETALRIIGAGFIVSAVSVTSSGALEGLGKGASFITDFTLPVCCGYHSQLRFYSAGFSERLASGMRFGSRKRLQQSFLFVFTTRQ